MVKYQVKVETSAYTAFVRRVVQGLGKRIGEGDAANLTDLISLQRELDSIIAEAVGSLRQEPHCLSWAEIGSLVGTSRQAAQMRWRHVGGARKVGGQPAHLR